jgi:hypothetical protein
MDDRSWQDGWARLLAVFTLNVASPEMAGMKAGAYRDALNDLGNDDWSRCVMEACRRDDGPFLPTPAKLRAYGGHVLQKGDSSERAQQMYDEIVDAYERGRRYGPNSITTDFGRAACRAFTSAGGDHAFSWCEPRNEPFRRKAFVDAFVEMIEADPALMPPALPEAKAYPALTAGTPPPEPSRTITHEEAVTILSGVRPDKAEAKGLLDEIGDPPRAVVATEERLALLKAQAAKLMGNAVGGSPLPMKRNPETGEITLTTKADGEK